MRCAQSCQGKAPLCGNCAIALPAVVKSERQAAVGVAPNRRARAVVTRRQFGFDGRKGIALTGRDAGRETIRFERGALGVFRVKAAARERLLQRNAAEEMARQHETHDGRNTARTR